MIEEISLPIILSLGLGVLHAHIVAPYTVKQRRKKTLNNPSSKIKPTLKNEVIPGVSSRKASLKTSQVSDVIIQQGHSNFNYLVDLNTDIIQSR